MVERRIARSTQPHLPTLAATLAPLLAPANAGAFHLRYEAKLSGSEVVIEQESFSGVNLTSVDNAVAAAPAHSSALDDKLTIDDLPKWHKAIVLCIIDQLNVVRQSPSTTFAAITTTAAWNAIKAKYDTL